MAKLMVTLTLPKKPTLDELVQTYGLDRGQLDEAFGVQDVDPDAGEYVILAEEAVVGRIKGLAGEDAAVYSNPTIGTFGPPEK